MHKSSSASVLHESFLVSIVLKGLGALSEVIAGLAFLKISPDALNRIVLDFHRHRTPRRSSRFYCQASAGLPHKIRSRRKTFCYLVSSVARRCETHPGDCALDERVVGLPGDDRGAGGIHQLSNIPFRPHAFDGHDFFVGIRPARDSSYLERVSQAKSVPAPCVTAANLLLKSVTGSRCHRRLFSVTYERFYSAALSISSDKFVPSEAAPGSLEDACPAHNKKATGRRSVAARHRYSIFSCQRAIFPALV